MMIRPAIEIFLAVLGALALLGLVTLAVIQQDRLSALREQNRALQVTQKEMDRLRTENQEAQRLRNGDAEIQLPSENSRELLRLRNEVRQLREQRQELEQLRAANAQLLQAMQSAANPPTNQAALIAAARRKGAILGVSIISANDPRLGAGAAGRSGVVVSGVMADSTGSESGLKPGDVIVALDGRAIENAAQLQTEMLTHRPGETILVDVIRGTEAILLPVRTRAWPESP